MNRAAPRPNWLDRQQVDRRLHARTGQPWLRVETQGFAYIALDWSVGGVAIEHFHDAGPVGTLISGQVGWATAQVLLPFTGDIIRQTPDGPTVLRWLDLPADFLTQLDGVVRQR